MRLLTRRRFATLLAGLAVVRPGHAAAAVPRLSVADVSNDVSVDLKDAERRLAIYKDLGFGMLRTAVVWSEFERQQGKWGLPPARQKYLDLIGRSGLKLKLEISALHSAPDWYLAANPNAQPRNEDNRTARQLLSVWHPGVAELVAEKQQRMLALLQSAGTLANTAAVLASLGPAGEPIYPASWQTEGGGKQGFWFYGPTAVAAFVAAMRQKFGDALDRANTRWGTRFGSWQQIEIPKPGTAHGARWEDVLIWYRDSKRAVVAAILKDVIAQTRAHAAADTPVVMLVPGGHTTEAEWTQAVASGEGAPSLRTMTDTDFLLDLSKETQAWLQHTAAQNEAAIRYLRDGMRARGLDVPLIAENAGGKPAQDPEHLVQVILQNHLYGLEYIGGADLFAADRITPSPLLPRMKSASGRIRDGLPAP